MNSTQIQRQFRVVGLDANGQVYTCFGYFYEVTPLVRRVLECARASYGDRAELQQLMRPSAEQWERMPMATTAHELPTALANPRNHAK